MLSGSGFRPYDGTDLKTVHVTVWVGFLCVFLGSPGFIWWFSIATVLFDNPGIFKCLSRLFLLSPRLYFTLGFICDLFVARNDSWIS